MPAIITHDTFGQEVYGSLIKLIGTTTDEYEAFLLGNQGPDPLFYSILIPTLHRHSSLSRLMHRQKTNELLVAFKQALVLFDEPDKAVARAYMLGFLCHYLLDSRMHPLIFFREYSLCDAGIDGLTRNAHHEVHAIIESELDEMVLFTTRSRTIATFDPSSEILRASDNVLGIVSMLYLFIALTVYGKPIPKTMFSTSTKTFRRVQRIFHSRNGIKRDMLGTFEELFRDHSFFRAMCLRDVENTTTPYDNHEHEPWTNPFTGNTSTQGFWDIFADTQEVAKKALPLYLLDRFSLEDARAITHDVDFSGRPLSAELEPHDHRHHG